MKNEPIGIRAYYDAHMAPQRISGPKMLCWGFVFGLFAIAGFVWLVMP